MAVPVIAVTGGIAAGKSLVCDTLARRGVAVIDADDLARQAVEPGPVLDSIAAHFGQDIVGADGTLDRQALGARVFGDPVAREALNSLVHPEVKRLYAKAVAELQSRAEPPIIVYAIPLLAEARSPEEFDLIVVVHAPAAIRIQRLQRHRGMSEEEARSRVEAQASDEDRLKIADVVIDSSRSEEETLRQAEQLYDVLHATWPDRLHEVPARFSAKAS